MERGGWRPKSGSKESCASGKELVDPASCPQIKGQHDGIERTAGTNPLPARVQIHSRLFIDSTD